MLFSLSKNLRFFGNAKCQACENIKKESYRSLKISPRAALDVESYRTLGLKSGADQEQVRRAFLSLCKIYHPDSGNPSADTLKFQEIETAYRNLQSKFVNERWDISEKIEEVKEFDIKHTAPQHRQFLSGTGSGTPSQLQHQLQQKRACDAADKLTEHKVRRVANAGDEIAIQNQKNAKKGLGMEKVIELQIQEAMARGEFENLKGAGKPLETKNCDPHIDFLTHKMNEIMIDNGFTPEWITLDKEIQEERKRICHEIQKNIHWVNSDKEWQRLKAAFEVDAKALNKKIDLFNLIVPILNKQKLLFSLESELKKAVAEGQDNGRSHITTSNPEKPIRKGNEGVFGYLSSIFRTNLQ